jgi:XTP/dITP diphosphohydrolase
MSSMESCIRIVIATGNAGKVRDFATVFDAWKPRVEVVSMQAYGGMPEVAETEPDFRGNALLKAEAAWREIGPDAGVWVLADDSGLAVDFLGGAPGVHSARYAGPGASDADNRNKLLGQLEGVPSIKRSAKFWCHLCLISPRDQRFHFEGSCDGWIATEARGANGFGYDPLFIPLGDTLTWGESDQGHKSANSHRGRATRSLLSWVEANLLV